jgi:tetratricopeptide (TPR) repeat protein
MEALPHYALSLAARGFYREAQEIFDEAREVGSRYQVLAPLSRCIAMQAGFHLDILDFAGAEELEKEARDLAASLNFPPTYVSAGIDLLLNYARRGEPERAEELEDEVREAVERESGWHGWLWNLRLAQANSELALARGQFDEAIACANEAIERSVATGRVKYHVAALGSRGQALASLKGADGALSDIRLAVDLARPVGDPAMFLRAATVLLCHQEDADVLAEARKAAEQIANALPDEAMRARFLRAAEVQRLGL